MFVMNDSKAIKQTKPIEKEVRLSGLYLKHSLKQMASNLNRSIVYTGYVTDNNDVIAVEGSAGPPKQVKNNSDWRLFQELLAQADVMITGSGYFQRVEKTDVESSQNVISQFNENAEFAELGDWRLKNDFNKRNPDIAVVSRNLDFNVPATLINSERKIIVFTTHQMYESEEADRLRTQGAEFVAGGVDSVDGRVMIDHLHGELNFRTIMMTTGPSVLNLLLKAYILDRLYITQVQRSIVAKEEKKITVLKNKKVDELEDFELTHEYLQEDAVMEDGETADQYFRIYDHKKLLFKIK